MYILSLAILTALALNRPLPYGGNTQKPEGGLYEYSGSHLAQIRFNLISDVSHTSENRYKFRIFVAQAGCL